MNVDIILWNGELFDCSVGDTEIYGGGWALENNNYILVDNVVMTVHVDSSIFLEYFNHFPTGAVVTNRPFE